MQSSNSSLAAAELQNRIKSSVEAAHGELRSTQILPAREEGAFRRISIRGQIAVNTAALQRGFYDLESASPFFFLDNLQISPPPAPRPPRVDVAPLSAPPPLEGGTCTRRAGTAAAPRTHQRGARPRRRDGGTDPARPRRIRARPPAHRNQGQGFVVAPRPAAARRR